MKKVKLSDDQFVHCPEFRVVRYERGKSQHHGLYVDGISICGVFCFQSKDGDRLSLIHANRFTRIETLLEEANWIEKGGRCMVYSKKKVTLHPVTAKKIIIGVDCIPELQEKSQCDYQVEDFGEKNIALLLRLDGTVELFDSIEHNLNIVYHPRLPQLECIYKINENLAYGKLLELKQETLVFDGTAWQKLQQHDLTLHPAAIQKIGELDVTRETDFWILSSKIREYAQGWIQTKRKFFADDINFIVLATQSGPVLELTAVVQQYLYSNDAKQQFIANVSSEFRILRDMVEQDDYRLRDALARALESEDPASAVSSVFKQFRHQSEYRETLNGIIMGFNGYHFHYQRSQLGTWQVEPEFEKIEMASKSMGI